METTIKTCNKLWLSQKEAAKYLGVSKDWLENQRVQGKLSFSKVANTIFYIKSEVDRLIINGAIFGKSEFKEEVIKSRSRK